MRRFRFSHVLLSAALAAAAAPAPARVMLQAFEMKWETMERRMPDIFLSGYGSLWLPPAARADSSNFSVGFDVYDRFDLGTETNPTLYGTETGLLSMIGEARKAGIATFFDTVYNHNGFSDGYRGDTGIPPASPCQLNWAIGEGGYPGFVMSGRDLGLPFDLEFKHICPSAGFPSPSCESDALNCRIAGLIDIANNLDGSGNPVVSHFWIRHPTTPGADGNIPYQQPRASNARFYPDQDLASPYGDGVKPFNTANPMAGDPTHENLHQMLQRYTQWMLEVNLVGGFRLDAVKHTQASWFNNYYDFAAHNRGRDFWGRQTTPFSFGEYVGGTSDFGGMMQHHRKDGYGNRTLLDYPLKFAMSGNIANVGGSFANILSDTFDRADDGDAQNGSAGVMFVSAHDNGIGDPPPLDNVAYAHILTRKGFPIVYFNAQEFGDGRDFPNRQSRGDALGDFGSSIITTLAKISHNHVNGISGNFYRSLWADADYIAYEMHNTLVVGMTDRTDNNGGLGYMEKPLSNFGFRGVTLTEITGNAADATVDPNDDIADTIAIPATGSVNLRVPTAANRNGVQHGRPYVAYTIAPPTGAFTVSPTAGNLGVDSNPNTKLARKAVIPRVTANAVTVSLAIFGGSLEDNAMVKWNHGINIDGSNSGDFGCAYGVDGLLAGYDDFTAKSPRFGGGTGNYSVTVDLTNPAIKEGMQYLSAVAFVQREGSLPPIYNTFRQVIYVDRFPPDSRVVFPPTQTGTNDIQSADYGFVVENPDGTANACHYFFNLAEGVDPVSSGLLNGSNRATRTDRIRYRFDATGLNPGSNRLTLVFFEETGNYSLTHYQIGVNIPTPTPTPMPVTQIYVY